MNLGTLQFLGRFFAMALVSALLHEFGHCLFYWLQGVPAAMSLVKEYPLRDITDLQYAIGSAGGPASSIVQVFVGGMVVQGSHPHSGLRKWALAFVLANVCYLIVRSVIVLLSGGGGELTAVASLVGVPLGFLVALLLLISIGALSWVLTTARVHVTWRRVLQLPAFLILYLVFIVGIQSLDRRLFWHRFPTIEIGEDRLYNQHR
jgi:hypothetical protein